MSQVHKLTMPKVRFDRAVHALQGLPICALCGASFSRWEVLEAHVTRQRCSQTLPDIPDTHSRPHSISQHALSEVACPTDTNEARDPAERITARPHSTHHLGVLRLLPPRLLHGGIPQRRRLYGSLL